MFDSAALKDNFLGYLVSHLKMIGIASGVSAVCFLLLKLFFPLPDFFVDSINYVAWAYYKWDVAFRPTGYCFFLRGANAISETPFFTVFAQYLLFFLSTLFCFLSADYLYKLPQKLKWPLLMVLIADPLLLLQTNLISSDSLFCSLTVIWFTLCLWIIKKHQWWALILQILMLYLAFEVRYTAIFFPLVAVAAFRFCSGKQNYKTLGILLSVLVIYGAVHRQTTLNEKQTHAEVFSGFAGWQIANNALYCYRHINVDIDKLPTKGLQAVDVYVKAFIDSVSSPVDKVGSAYIWDANSPFKRFSGYIEKKAHTSYIASWFLSSVYLSDYGWYIVRHYPMEFTQYYLLPNTVNYFYPDPEALGNYNIAGTHIPYETQFWFNLESDHLSCLAPDLQKFIIAPFPFISLLVNAVNILAILFFLVIAIPRWKKVPRDARSLFLTWSIFYFAFMGFTIFAAAVNLRFMDPIFVLGLIAPVLLWNAAMSLRSEKILSDDKQITR